MLTVACVNVGNYQGQGAEYVRRLRASLVAHFHLPHEFVCLSDDPGSSNGYDCLEIPSEPAGWWSKLHLFRLFWNIPVLYFDLDTVIRGEITELTAAVPAAGLAMLRDVMGARTYGSAIMAWRDDLRHIWDDYEGQARRGGDQQWIAEREPPSVVIQERCPGLIASYKGGYTTEPVICFHGRPKPHEVGWDV